MGLSPHAGLSTDCAACHTTSAFKPTTFVHKSVGEHMGPGAEHPIDCAKCHPTKYTDRNCMGSGCHRTNTP